MTVLFSATFIQYFNDTSMETSNEVQSVLPKNWVYFNVRRRESLSAMMSYYIKSQGTKILQA
jgi:hypothetical protein